MSAASTGDADGLLDPPPSPSVGPQDGPSIAYISYTTGEHDARSFRMARSAIRAGYRVTIYARWHPGQPPIEYHDGYRLIRAPIDWRLAVPGLRIGARKRAAAAMATSARLHREAVMDVGGDGQDDEFEDLAPATTATTWAQAGTARGGRASVLQRVGRGPARLAKRINRWVSRPFDRYRRLTRAFPLRPLGWAAALESVVEPADVWHGMHAGSLPALDRMRRRHGGRTIYDSRDVYMMSREFYRLGWPLRSILAGLERRWAHAVDRVLTVNEHCADLLVGQLRIPRPVVVMNCREAWTPPDPRPDRIRSVLDLSPETLIVLYEGALMGERGIEQSMDAILDVPGAVLVLLGFGSWERRLRDHAAAPPYVGRVFVLPAVAPDDLLEWIASADVMVMPIQDTTINHRFSTPQKLFEAIAAGVPVVASDLPGMAEVVSESDVGVLCDPTSPAAIAAAIRTILEKPQDERGRMRARILHIAHERYDWETQLRTLLEVYGELAPVPVAPATSAEVRAPSVS